MRVFISFFLLLLYSSLVFAQEGEQKKISFRAEWQYHDEETMPGVDRFIGNVVFTHENTIGYCDSAYHFSNDNYLIAYGNPVTIHINDSVTLYGKYVNYNANSGITSIYRDVVLRDKISALYTDSLIYDKNRSVGFYVTGGKMVDKKNTLTSVFGQYFTKENVIVLTENVKLVNKTYSMTCQSMRYNTQSERVFFTSRTHLISDENNIYTNRGWYDIPNDLALLVDSVLLVNETQSITGDSMFYDKNKHFGTAWNNVVLKDLKYNYIVTGNYAEHFENGGTSMVTDSILLTLIDDEDSLFLHSDTLQVLFDSLQEPQIMSAFNKVKFYRENLQGVCDSMSYIVKDSTMIMYFNPVVWSGENQLSADTIRFTMVDSANSSLELCKNGFIVVPLFNETEFNQIKGLNIIGHIHRNKLTKVDIINNAESLYYVLDEDTALIGINSSVTSEMSILLENNKISDIIFYNNPDGKIYPDNALKSEDRFLSDFRWLKKYRPNSISDLFHTPIPRLREKK